MNYLQRKLLPAFQRPDAAAAQCSWRRGWWQRSRGRAEPPCPRRESLKDSAGCARRAGPRFSAESVPGGAQQAFSPLRSPRRLWRGPETVKAIPESFSGHPSAPWLRGRSPLSKPPAPMQAGCWRQGGDPPLRSTPVGAAAAARPRFGSTRACPGASPDSRRRRTPCQAHPTWLSRCDPGGCLELGAEKSCHGWERFPPRGFTHL